MTIAEIKTAMIEALDLKAEELGMNTTLDQDQLDGTVDVGVTVLNTINPNSTRLVIRS